jgi:hypothetical protein
METGRIIVEETIPIIQTSGGNGQVNVPFQAVEVGDYEIVAQPSSKGNWFEVVRTYVSISPGGPPVNESYALHINFGKRDARIYVLNSAITMLL